MKLWDISRTLSNDLAPWPGDTPVSYQLNRRIADGAVVNLGSITMSVHNGTHGDAEFHFEAAGRTMDHAPLEPYLGRAVVADLAKDFSSGKKGVIEIANLQAQAEAIAETSRLLIKTNVWLDSTVFPKQIPVIEPDVAEWLQARGVRLLGLDLPSVDGIDAKFLQNHHALGRAKIAIIESLDLSRVEAGIYNFVALPLKIAGGDGAPVRAILWRE